VVPHIASRANAFTLKDGAPADADYVLLHGPSVAGDASRTALNIMFARDEYGLIAKGDDLYLFKRGVTTPETRSALSTLHLKKPKRSNSSDD
jgi:hypothetical protein